MTVFIAYLHIVTLAFGFSALKIRGIRLKDSLETGNVKKILMADNLWGIAAILWIGTGLLRLLGGYDKEPVYYMHNHWFMGKMTLFLFVVLLELKPMITFMKWRFSKKTQITAEDHSKVRKIMIFNHIESALILIIPFFASAMARGGIH